MKSSKIISKIKKGEIVFLNGRGEELVMQLIPAKARFAWQCCKSDGLVIYASYYGHSILAIVGCLKHMEISYEIARLSGLRPIAVVPLSVRYPHLDRCLLCLNYEPYHICVNCAKRIEKEIHEQKTYSIFE